MSAADLDKGGRWFADIGEQLKGTNLGILCLTRENLEEPWIHFEAGALSKTVEKTFVCPYLFGLEPTDIKGPLVQFQATRAEQDDTRKLLQTINKALGDPRLDERRLDETFDVWWPKLKQNLDAVPQGQQKQKPKRTVPDLLEEILTLTRQLTRERAMTATAEVGLRALSRGLGGLRRPVIGRAKFEKALVDRAFAGPSPSGFFGFIEPYEAYEEAVAQTESVPKEGEGKSGIGDVDAPPEKKETNENP
jgi:hypothetical protein